MKKQDDEQVVDDQKVEDQQLDENADSAREGMDINDQEESRITEEEQDLLGDLQRVQADFVNFKRSVDNQLSQAEQRGKLQTTVKFLNVIDDIERALSHMPEELKSNQWVQGLNKVYVGLNKKMSELGLAKIEALGVDFDPELHEAVMRGESESEKVTEVLKNGYTYEGVVVRHAMVKVG
jgi:molecular chaperone GrpE